MWLIKWIMQILARSDFRNHRSPRFTNNFYSNEYGNCYARAAANDYFTGG